MPVISTSRCDHYIKLTAPSSVKINCRIISLISIIQIALAVIAQSIPYQFDLYVISLLRYYNSYWVAGSVKMKIYMLRIFHIYIGCSETLIMGELVPKLNL